MSLELVIFQFHMLKNNNNNCKVNIWFIKETYKSPLSPECLCVSHGETPFKRGTSLADPGWGAHPARAPNIGHGHMILLCPKAKFSHFCSLDLF